MSFGADETGTSVGLVPLVIPLGVGVVALLPLENQPPPVVGVVVALVPLVMDWVVVVGLLPLENDEGAVALTPLENPLAPLENPPLRPPLTAASAK